jgi:hypothetical protein
VTESLEQLIVGGKDLPFLFIDRSEAVYENVAEATEASACGGWREGEHERVDIAESPSAALDDPLAVVPATDRGVQDVVGVGNVCLEVDADEGGLHVFPGEDGDAIWEEILADTELEALAAMASDADGGDGATGAVDAALEFLDMTTDA